MLWTWLKVYLLFLGIGALSIPIGYFIVWVSKQGSSKRCKKIAWGMECLIGFYLLYGSWGLPIFMGEKLAKSASLPMPYVAEVFLTMFVVAPLALTVLNDIVFTTFKFPQFLSYEWSHYEIED